LRIGGRPAPPRPPRFDIGVDIDVPGFGVIDDVLGADVLEEVGVAAVEVDGSDLMATDVADRAGSAEVAAFLDELPLISSKIFSSRMASAMMSFLRSWSRFH
jgi:hypothetical protein